MRGKTAQMLDKLRFILMLLNIMKTANATNKKH